MLKRFNDDRTKQQKQTHTVVIAGTDSFMSGWGRAAGGASFAAWACRPEHARHVERWVRGRPEMKRVRSVTKNWKGRSAAHVHIYVADVHTWGESAATIARAQGGR